VKFLERFSVGALPIFGAISKIAPISFSRVITRQTNVYNLLFRSVPSDFLTKRYL